MIQERKQVFETNSSSTHSITITSEKNYDDWVAGRVQYDEWKDVFSSPSEMTDADKEACREAYQRTKPSFYKDWEDLSEDDKQSRYNEYAKEHVSYEDDMLTYPEWRARHSGCEFITSRYTTEHGDKVVAFGYAGYDG